MTRNAPLGCPQPLDLPATVVSVSLDYSANSPFADDPRFLASAKFFGLLTLPENRGASIQLGVGGLDAGDSPQMIPQSWVPTPSLALRQLDLNNEQAIIGVSA